MRGCAENDIVADIEMIRPSARAAQDRKRPSDHETGGAWTWAFSVTMERESRDIAAHYLRLLELS